jgi:hypothetical protein
MAIPTNREDFIDFCLRRLGAPVIEINVDHDQVEDKVDDALQLFNEYHDDGLVRVYESHQVSATDITNGYITLGSDVAWVTRVFPVSSIMTNSGSMFDVKYQMMLNSNSFMSNLGDLAYYEQFRQYMSIIDDKLNGQILADFQREQNRLYIHGSFTDQDFKESEYLAVECFKAVDVGTTTSIWNNRWLKDYTTALIKQQWGNNLMKYDGVQLPGGVMFNGRQYYDDASEELDMLRDKLVNEFQSPPSFIIG